MTDFIKQWITSTLVPESVQNLATTKSLGGSFDRITNEDGTLEVFVISYSDPTLADKVNIGTTRLNINTNVNYTSMEAVRKVAELLKLTSISV